MESQGSVALPELFEIVAGVNGAHSRSAGSGMSERVTFPVRWSTGFTMIVDVARVVPSAGTTLGRVAVIVKSGLGIGVNVEEGVRGDSAACGVVCGYATKQSNSTSNRILLLNGKRLRKSPDSSDISRPMKHGKVGVVAFFP